MDQTAFFITPIGSPGSPVRERADEIQSLIEDAVKAHSIRVVRADQIGEPGMVSEQIVRSILQAAMVFADLTGANANVYYELGVAHSFGRPVVAMVDKARDLTFDTAHDRAIIIGDDGRLSLAQGRELAVQLRSFVARVMGGSYAPSNVVTYASSRISAETMAAENPLLDLMGKTHDSVEALRLIVERTSSVGGQNRYSDADLLRKFIDRILESPSGDLGFIRNALLDGRTSAHHDEWVERLTARLSSRPSTLEAEWRAD